MKRVFTLLCALILLLTNFSGAVVSAAAVDESDLVPATDVVAESAATETTEPATTETEATEPAGEEVATEVIERSEVISNTVMPKNYKAPREQEVGQSFVDYVQPYIAACATEIPVSQFNLPASAGSDLIYLIYYESPELFSPCSMKSYYNSSTGLLTKLEVVKYEDYSDTPEEYAACLKGIRSAADYLVKGVENNNNLTDVEKALVLHDRLAVWTEYDLGFTTNAIYSAVGPLANQSGVCQGYALAYMYLLERADIESDLVLSESLNHAWNIVYIDGVGYHVDVTWDDPTNSSSATYYDDYGRVWHENFLLSSNGIWNTGHKAYDYNTEPTDTRYDNAGWWRATETAIQLIGNSIYWMENAYGYIYEQVGNESYDVYMPGYYNVKSYKLSSAGGKLLFSTEKEVQIFDLAGDGPATTLFTPSYAQYSGAYIEGLKYEKGKIWVQVYYNGRSYRESMDYVPTEEAVKIVTQPQSVVVASNGSTVTVTVKATGDGLRYVWYAKSAGDSEYGQAMIDTDTFSMKMTSELDGTKVYCVITDIYGNSVTSNIATLYMGETAKITTQPTNAANPNGKAVKTTLKATGDGLTYAWYYLKRGAENYVKSASLTSNYFTVKMSSAWHGAKVYCEVSDMYGNTVKSKVVTLYMGNPAKIATQPKSIVAIEGKTAKITMKATGDGLKYSWYYLKAGAKKYAKSGSLTSNYFAVKMSSAWHGAKVYCVVTDKYGISVKTSVVVIKKANLAKITTQPTNAASPSGKKVKVTVKATGDGLSYEWFYAKKGSSKYKSTGIKTASYSVKMSSSVNGRKVYCVVKDKYGTAVKSKVVTLHKGTPVKLTKQIVNTKAPAGLKATLTIGASGKSLKYTWYHKSAGAAKFSVSSVKTKTYSVKMSASVKGRQVYCVVTDKYGVSVKSAVVTLGLAASLKITQQPSNVTVANGKAARVTIKASGEGVTYTWYHKNKGASKFTKASPTGTTYSATMSDKVNGRQVYCVVKDKYGVSIKSKVVTLKKQTFNPSVIVGAWDSHTAYLSSNNSYYYFYKATMYIYSDGTASLYMSSNSLFNSGWFSLYYYYDCVSDGRAFYRFYNANNDLTGVYDPSSGEFFLFLESGSFIVFDR